MKENDNPYLQSKALWNDLYGSVQTKLQNTKHLLWIALATIMILTIAMIIITARNPIKPYVTVLKNNEVLTLNEFESDSFTALKPKLAMALATDFIKTSRTLSIDDEVNLDRKIKSIAYTAEGATKVLLDYFKAQDGLTNVTLSIQLQTVLVKSQHTLVFRWLEAMRDKQSGEVLQEGSYTAEMTVNFIEKYQTELQQKMNPLGFYITHLAWAKDLEGG